MAVRSQNLTAEEIADQVAVYTAGLARFDPRAVSAGCMAAAKRHKFFPALAELLELVDDEQQRVELRARPAQIGHETWFQRVSRVLGVPCSASVLCRVELSRQLAMSKRHRDGSLTDDEIRRSLGAQNEREVA